MSLSFDRIENRNPYPVALAGKKVLYMYTDADCGKQHIDLPENETFEQVVNKDTERTILYVTGMSGAGKSYYTKKYIEKYHKAFPKRTVFMFSSLESDPTLDKLKYMKRVKINEQKFQVVDLTAQDFKDSLCIFDDCDVISNKRIRGKVFDIMNSILQIGRHHNVSCVFTSHNATNGQQTKTILSECHTLTLFPKCSGIKSLLYLCDSYLGLDSEQSKNLKKIPGRFVTFVRQYPRCIFSEKSASIMN